jgi:hypothetical protein
MMALAMLPPPMNAMCCDMDKKKVSVGLKAVFPDFDRRPTGFVAKVAALTPQNDTE